MLLVNYFLSIGILLHLDISSFVSPRFKTDVQINSYRNRYKKFNQAIPKYIWATKILIFLNLENNIIRTTIQIVILLNLSSLIASDWICDIISKISWLIHHNVSKKSNPEEDLCILLFFLKRRINFLSNKSYAYWEVRQQCTNKLKL